MNRDIKIEVRLVQKDDQDKLMFVLFGQGFHEQGEELSNMLRDTDILTAEETIALLMGDMGGLSKDDAKEMLDNVSERISQWFLGEDLKLTMKVIFGGLTEKDQIRLIFSPHVSLRSIAYDLYGQPLELIRPDRDKDPYVLSPQVAAIVHLLDKPQTTAFSATSLDYPLRVLIVRSNPPGLGLTVPEAAPIRDEILTLGRQLGPDAVMVDVLSSEQAINKPATWSALTNLLESQKEEPYDILIYLGHGSLQEDGARQAGALQLEAEDGGGPKAKLGRELVTPLANHKIPVVLLVACLTAAQIAEENREKFKELHKKRAPEWIRGSQGVAQTLINGGTATQVAIGMRYRLEIDDAKLFIKKFFDSLLTKNKGNVEAAVHLARESLKSLGYPTAYSAPMIFSANHKEPVFPFLNESPRSLPVCNKPEGEWEARSVFWKMFQARPWETRSEESKKDSLEVLIELEKQAIKTATMNAALIMPEMLSPEKPDFFVKKPGELIKVPVKLYGSLDVSRLNMLEGRIVVDHADVTILGGTSSAELNESGYEASFSPKDRQVVFTIKPSADANTKILSNVKLFEVSMLLGTSFATRYNIVVSGIKSDPQVKVCPGASAVIVPPPLSN